jgi:hypothetical protein
VTGDPEGLTHDPVTYEIKGTAANPFLYRHSTKHTHVVESNILDVRFDNFPFALCVNPAGVAGSNAFPVSPYIGQLSVGNGIYNGKRVHYLGGNDRLFAGGFAGGFNPATLFFGGYFSGEHADGSHQYGCVIVIIEAMGQGAVRSFGFHCQEGALGKRSQRKTEVVTSSDVHGAIHWAKLNWQDTPVIAKATYKFGGKDIQFEPKFGFSVMDSCSGPPVGTIANCSGPWREKHSKNDFKRSMVFGESHATMAMVSLSKPTTF